MSERQPEENGNLLNFIASTVEMIRDRMATKDDIARLDSRIDKLEATTANKEYLARLEFRLDKLEVKVDRLGSHDHNHQGRVEQVYLRADAIKKALSSRLDHFESEMSRMCSVASPFDKARP